MGGEGDRRKTVRPGGFMHTLDGWLSKSWNSFDEHDADGHWTD
jgi:hypothetical protein